MTIPWMMNCPHSDDSWCLDCVYEMGQELQRVQELNERLVADGVRWQYVKRLAQTTAAKMDSQHSWRFQPLRYGRGATIDEAVDNEIAIVKPTERKSETP